ncbi:MAG TPA: hypothetical protein VFE47_13040 [Tepidisphaeraceae bacterium]|jgi:hypothetical protein|nr:hypothetical protein [Tepidisphaeraceae bacterium]
MSRAFEEIVDYMAGRAPDVVAGFQPSQETIERAMYLSGRLKDGMLTPEEAKELDGFVKLESIMARAKARAL